MSKSIHFRLAPALSNLVSKVWRHSCRGMIQLQGLHNIRPKYPVLSLIANLPIVADQPGPPSASRRSIKGPDLWMDGNNAVLTGFRFGAALHCAFLQVYIFRFQVQKFRDTPPGI